MRKSVWKGAAFVAVLMIVAFAPLYSFNILPAFADTTNTSVSVTGVAPYVIDSEIFLYSTVGDSDDGIISLSENTSVTIYCNGTVNDDNGFNDISGVNVTFWDASTTIGNVGADDNNDQYSNLSCDLATGSGTSRGFECSVEVQYYANNATWSCNVSAYDSGGSHNSTYANTTIAALAAIEIPSSINFGTVNPGENSSVQRINVTNTGNKQIDITVFGYANGQTTSPNALNCTEGSVKNITLSQLRYNASNTGVDLQCDDITWYGNTSRLFNTSNQISYSGFDLAARTNDALEARAITCWVLQVPVTGVGGNCRGVVDITGAAG